MENNLEKRIQELEGQLRSLLSECEDVKKNVPKNSLVIGVISGDLDKILAAFIIALGASAYDMEVHMFFTFWAIAAFRDPKKRAKKDFISRMFGWMLPKGTHDLPLSSMNMLGIGPKMIRGIMKKKGVAQLEELMKHAGELDVKVHLCEMSMDLMGFKQEEMIDYPNLDYVGVGTFIDMAHDAKQTFFL